MVRAPECNGWVVEAVRVEKRFEVRFEETCATTFRLAVYEHQIRMLALHAINSHCTCKSMRVRSECRWSRRRAANSDRCCGRKGVQTGRRQENKECISHLHWGP